MESQYMLSRIKQLAKPLSEKLILVLYINFLLSLLL